MRKNQRVHGHVYRYRSFDLGTMNVTPKLEDLEKRFGDKGVRMEVNKQLNENLLSTEGRLLSDDMPSFSSDFNDYRAPNLSPRSN